MRLLLDTHVALWAITDDPALPAKARDLILAGNTDVYVSAASIWEISIKHGLGRKSAHAMPVSGAHALQFFEAAGYFLLPVSPEHAAAVETLPKRHADPFDRLLIAQALYEPLRLMTHDPDIAGYSETIIKI